MVRDVDMKKTEYFSQIGEDEDDDNDEDNNVENNMEDENEEDDGLVTTDVIMFDNENNKNETEVKNLITEDDEDETNHDDDDDDEEEDDEDDDDDDENKTVGSDKQENSKKNVFVSRTKFNKISRRQTIDTTNLRQLVLRNNNNNEIRSKLTQTLNLNKNQIIIDYNILAFMENREIESDHIMENRMTKFINSFKKKYKGIQHIEYKINNKLFCAIDIIYFLPILFNKSENRELAQLNRKNIDAILERLDLLSEKLLPKTTKLAPLNTQKKTLSTNNLSSSSSNNSTNNIIPENYAQNATTSIDSSGKNQKKTNKQPETMGDRNIRLYQIGSDYYLMCRKKQNFVDGQKNLEKKYGKCRLLKVWNNRNDVKYIGKLILSKFPHMKWNARTNILSNSKNKQVSENDLLNYLIKVIK